MLEVGAVRGSRRPHDNGRLAFGPRGDRLQRLEQEQRVLVDRAHPVVGKERGDEARHRDPVLQHVRDARGRADVVLQDLPAAVGVADEVAARDVRVHAAGRANAVGRAREVRAARDQRPRDDLRLDDLALVVHVSNEVVERPDSLREPTLDHRPLRRWDDPRHQVERERAVRDGAIGGRQVECDALAHEERIAQLAGRDEPLRTEALELRDQRFGVRAACAMGVEDLVVDVAQLLARAHSHILDQPVKAVGRHSGQSGSRPFVRAGGRLAGRIRSGEPGRLVGTSLTYPQPLTKQT